MSTPGVDGRGGRWPDDQGRRHRKGMVQDYDQAAFLIGACFEGSGINATETLKKEAFQPHPALGALLEWLAAFAATSEIRTAARRASMLFRGWRARNQYKDRQQQMFFGDQEDGS